MRSRIISPAVGTFTGGTASVCAAVVVVAGVGAGMVWPFAEAKDPSTTKNSKE
jgi:hypothetical protein